MQDIYSKHSIWKPYHVTEEWYPVILATSVKALFNRIFIFSVLLWHVFSKFIPKTPVCFLTWVGSKRKKMGITTWLHSFLHFTISSNSLRHQLEEAYFLEKITTAILESLIACFSLGPRDWPLLMSLSLKTRIGLRSISLWKWLRKPLRMSSPLKLRKRSFSHLREQQDRAIQGKRGWN